MMPLPALANVFCDIYRPGNAPPAAADVSGVPGHLASAFHHGLSAGRLIPVEQRFTHLLLLESDVDVRDNYDGGVLAGDADTVAIDTAAFRVVFVERRQRGTVNDHLRVYLSRTVV